ncbi:MAG: hypothetical protein IT274_08875 [Chitinophagales bacterium]|nr:hypothetical protein [Chitinophagales bacterium]
MQSYGKKTATVILSAIIAWMAVSCSVDNKSIPDPGGNIGVDTTGTIGTFFLNLTGDTSYLLTIVAVDTIVQDSLVVAGGDLTTKDQVVFSTAKAEPGTYYTEQSPPGITGAVCVFRKRIPSGFRNYPMLRGKIVISSVDPVSGVVRGNLDVNNKYVPNADKYYRLSGSFMIKLNP